MKRLPSLLIYFIFSLGTLFTNCIDAQTNENTQKILLNAQREDHFGIPFLYLKGNDYEVGYQYGYLLKSLRLSRLRGLKFHMQTLHQSQRAILPGKHLQQCKQQVCLPARILSKLPERLCSLQVFSEILLKNRCP
jgi:hypothetical protein